jgi:heme-degrading monooxygenase HmoA
MIARVWSGQTTREGADAYRRHFTESVRPTLASLSGHRGAIVLSREVKSDSSTEFLVVTLWDSMDAVRAFAGPDPERAVVAPAARALLAAFDPFAQHYDVVLDTRDPSGCALLRP